MIFSRHSSMYIGVLVGGYSVYRSRRVNHTLQMMHFAIRHTLEVWLSVVFLHFAIRHGQHCHIGVVVYYLIGVECDHTLQMMHFAIRHYIWEEGNAVEVEVEERQCEGR